MWIDGLDFLDETDRTAVANLITTSRRTGWRVWLSCQQPRLAARLAAFFDETMFFFSEFADPDDYAGWGLDEHAVLWLTRRGNPRSGLVHATSVGVEYLVTSEFYTRHRWLDPGLERLHRFLRTERHLGRETAFLRHFEEQLRDASICP